jgi:thiol-disulfide isomerase/thioredoxin
MATFYEAVHEYLKPYYNYILIFVLVVIFFYVGTYSYNKFIVEKRATKNFDDIANAETDGKDLEILFFYADWCPHCKTAKPEWNAFKSMYNGKRVNGYNIVCVDVNCTEETSAITKTMNEHEIDSFPTIKMSKDDESIDYEARITTHNLEKFVETMT